MSGFVIYLCCVPISWRSKGQKTVTLSSTEAKWIALSEIVKEILFIAQILESIDIKVQKPIKIKVDNTAAIFMATNVTTSQRTKHIDIQSKFVLQYCENGTTLVKFMRGTDNDADIFTKNVTKELHEKHLPKLIINSDKLDNVRKSVKGYHNPIVHE